MFVLSNGIVGIPFGGDNTTFAVIVDIALNTVSNLDLTTTLIAGNYTAFAEDNLGCTSIGIPFTIGAQQKLLLVH